MEQNAIVAWPLAALVVLLVGLCTVSQALVGVAIGYSATLGAPVLQRWYDDRRRP